MRYYLSRRIGTGIPGTDDPFRCETHDWLTTNFPGQQNSPSGFVGHVCAWTLRPYDLTPIAHAALLVALPNTYALPDVPVATRLNQLTALVSNELIAKFDLAGFDMTWTNPATDIKDILDYFINSCQVAEWLDIQIGVKDFDVRRRTLGNLLPEQRTDLQRTAAFFGADQSGFNAATTINQVVQRLKVVRLRDGKPPLSENGIRL